MKKRVNITIDEELHSWTVSHFGEGEFSKIVQDQLTAISSSVFEEKKMKTFDEWLEKQNSKEELEKAFELHRKYDHTDEGYPLNLDEKTESTIKRIAFSHNIKEKNIIRKKYKSYVSMVVKEKMEEMIDQITDMVLQFKEEEKDRTIELMKLKESLEKK